MGNKCCSDRNKQGDDNSAEPVKVERNEGPRKTSASVINLIPADSQVRPSVLLGVKGKDAEKFDEAFANMDIPAFVELLNSENSLGEGQLEEVPEHPWADMPASVGALAATQLAVIASMDEANVVTIRQANACEVLVNYLKAKCPPDKRDAGVVLLVFLTSVDGESCADLGQKNVLPDLLRILGDKAQHRGLRCAVSTILINVLLEHQGTASRFIRENGAVQLLKACDSSGSKPDEEPFFLELIENFIELTEADDTGAASKFLPSIRKAVSGSPNTLKSLARKFPGSELEANVSQLMEVIS